MARTNQGVFKEYLNNFKEFKEDYARIIEKYNNPNIDFFDGLAQESSCLYDELNVFSNKLDGLIESTKFENDINKKKYEKYKEECSSMSSELQENFKKIVNEINHSGGLSDAERNTIDNMLINKQF